MTPQDASINGLPSAVPPLNPCVPSMVEVDLDGVSGRIDQSLVNKVRKLVDEHPDRALEVIRAWMAEDYRH